MKRIITIIILTTLLVGCKTTEKVVEKNQVEQKFSESNYRTKIKKVTGKSNYEMIVEDFDNDGNQEAFVLTKDKKEGGESEFQLWFLKSNDSTNIMNSFFANKDTSIKLFNSGNLYILLNISQVRQNDEMQAVIYGVKDNKAVKLFAQSGINLFIQNDELYTYNYTYSVLEPGFKEWMSLSEQKYHFKWNNEIKMCEEYKAYKIPENKFMEMKQSDELKEKIVQEINNHYSSKIRNIKYCYLLREDETLDVNMIVVLKNREKHKHYVTVPCINNVLKTEFELFEGNKKESLLEYLNR